MALFWRGRGNREILPDEILLDASNLPGLDADQLEGRVEHPVSRISIIILGVIFALAGFLFVGRVFELQVVRGAEYAQVAKENSLAQSVVFAARGVLYDVRGEELAWNEGGEAAYALRKYTDRPGLSHVLGFVRYPKTDQYGKWWRTELVGASGAERVFNARLEGENGQQIVEVNSLGEIVREQVIVPAANGRNIELSIDAELQSELFGRLTEHSRIHGFEGGAAVIMDVKTGELLALTSFPEFDSQAMTDGDEEVVGSYAIDERKPFLNRAISGAYTPGSIVKPLFAAAALAEDLVSPLKSFYSSGELSLPNPYEPGTFTVFPDWRAHGWVDLRRAIAVSSNVYFFTIGGGFEEQEGLGIFGLESWARAFGLGEATSIALQGEVEGVIPTPRWKEETFDGDEWRIGDTYNTSIGQYGFQVTPVQAAVAIAALANGGERLTPQLMKDADPERIYVDISDVDLDIVREGMRRAVTDEDGTARALSFAEMEIAGKTGTAQVGAKNQWMHSWVVGFWPYEKPRYAFAVVLEEAPAGTLAGAAPSMRPFFDWLILNRPEYLQ